MTEKKLSSVTAEKLHFKIRSSCWLIAISIRGLFFPSHLLSLWRSELRWEEPRAPHKRLVVKLKGWHNTQKILMHKLKKNNQKTDERDDGDVNGDKKAKV